MLGGFDQQFLHAKKVRILYRVEDFFSFKERAICNTRVHEVQKGLCVSSCWEVNGNEVQGCLAVNAAKQCSEILTSENEVLGMAIEPFWIEANNFVCVFWLINKLQRRFSVHDIKCSGFASFCDDGTVLKHVDLEP